MDADQETANVFDKAKAQARVVGSAVFSFAQGVTAEVRSAISDSVLLAQLHANKKVSVEKDPLAWFRVNTEVLQNVGWMLQDGAWTDYTTQGKASEVHQKIIEVLAVALGPTPAALAIVTSTMTALKAMNPNSPWISIFSHEAQKARMARFQIGLVEKEEADDIVVSLFAYLIEAQSEITQVLLFKFRQANATFKANSAKVCINRAALDDLGPAIRGRVRSYQISYVSSILDI
jgi:hypothetical protein